MEAGLTNFERRRDRELHAYADGDETDLPYLASIPDVAEDDYVVMCKKADYAAFYIEHTAGDPQPIAPRYEFWKGLDPWAKSAK